MIPISSSRENSVVTVATSARRSTVQVLENGDEHLVIRDT